MLGSDEKLKWKLEDDALVIGKPLKFLTGRLLHLK
jgi:hypothetical protein